MPAESDTGSRSFSCEADEIAERLRRNDRDSVDHIRELKSGTYFASGIPRRIKPPGGYGRYVPFGAVLSMYEACFDPKLREELQDDLLSPATKPKAYRKWFQKISERGGINFAWDAFHGYFAEYVDEAITKACDETARSHGTPCTGCTMHDAFKHTTGISMATTTAPDMAKCQIHSAMGAGAVSLLLNVSFDVIAFLYQNWDCPWSKMAHRLHSKITVKNMSHKIVEYLLKTSATIGVTLVTQNVYQAALLAICVGMVVKTILERISLAADHAPASGGLWDGLRWLFWGSWHSDANDTYSNGLYGAGYDSTGLPPGLEVPESMVCPITNELMFAPVQLRGQLYEQAAIVEWVSKRGEDVFRTRSSLYQIRPCPEMAALCSAFAEEYNLPTV